MIMSKVWIVLQNAHFKFFNEWKTNSHKTANFYASLTNMVNYGSMKQKKTPHFRRQKGSWFIFLRIQIAQSCENLSTSKWTWIF